MSNLKTSNFSIKVIKLKCYIYTVSLTKQLFVKNNYNLNILEAFSLYRIHFKLSVKKCLYLVFLIETVANLHNYFNNLS